MKKHFQFLITVIFKFITKCDGLIAWEGNMDIQPVFNHYKAVAYMCAYLSKSESECSVAMKQAVQAVQVHLRKNLIIMSKRSQLPMHI